MTKKTRGAEQFEHLFDKSNLLLFMLDDEAKEIADLQSSVNALKRERNEVRRINRELTAKVEQLSDKRTEIDVKAGDLLEALNAAHFS